MIGPGAATAVTEHNRKIDAMMEINRRWYAGEITKEELEAANHKFADPGTFKSAPLAPHLQESNAAACAALVQQATAGIFSIGAPFGVKLYLEDPAPKLNELLMAAGIRFTDAEFDTSGPWNVRGRAVVPGICSPHNYELIANGHRCLGKVQKWMYSKATWQRISACDQFAELNGAAPALFDQSISAHDINQGQIGNCWLCAQFAAVASAVPQAIETAFSPASPSPAGCHSLRLFVRGMPYYMLLDDRVPCLPVDGMVGVTGQALNMHSANAAEFWPRLLEKGFGKLAGGVGCLIGCVGGATGRAKGWGELWGGGGEPFVALTGVPHGAYVNHNQPGKEQVMLDRLREESWLRTCSTHTPSKGPGLVGNHAYSLLWSGQVEGVYLLVLRNPWGKKEWTGDWSDKSSRWDRDPKVKAALLATGLFAAVAGIKAPAFHDPSHSAHADDGAFLIALPDFQKHFEGITACGPLERAYSQPGFVDLKAEMDAVRASTDTTPIVASPVQGEASLVSLSALCEVLSANANLKTDQQVPADSSLARCQGMLGKSGTARLERPDAPHWTDAFAPWSCSEGGSILLDLSEEMEVSSITIGFARDDGRNYSKEMEVSAVRHPSQAPFPLLRSSVGTFQNATAAREVTFELAPVGQVLKTRYLLLRFGDCTRDDCCAHTIAKLGLMGPMSDAMARAEAAKAKRIAEAKAAEIAVKRAKRDRVVSAGAMAWRIVVPAGAVDFFALDVRHLRFYTDPAFEAPLTREMGWEPLDSGAMEGEKWQAANALYDGGHVWWGGRREMMTTGSCEGEEAFYLGLCLQGGGEGARVLAVSFECRDHKPQCDVAVEALVGDEWIWFGEFSGREEGEQRAAL